jgi:PAS domain S-box-containing protein
LQLLDLGDPTNLQAYLDILKTGADVDFILVCSRDGQPVASSSQNLTAELAGVCGLGVSTRYDLDNNFAAPQAWLISDQLVPNDAAGREVVVGQALDQSFTVQMGNHTGLEHTLLAGGRLLASSFQNTGLAWQTISTAFQQAALQSDGRSHTSFLLDGTPYFSLRFPLDETGLESVVSLSLADLAATQRQLTTILSASILAVAVLGSAFGVLRARRISRPLAQLRTRARALRKGDLHTPVTVQTHLREVAQVAYALEDARVALQHTLEELRKEKAWTDHLLESVVEGILTLDQHGRITFFSQGAERITGWEQAQVIGRSCDEIFRPVEGSEQFSQLLPPPGGRQKVVVTVRSGRPATLAITGASLAPPEAIKARVVLVMRDVSDEEAIRRLLGDFLANISHEFRTPLSALAASIELLLDQLPDLSQDELGELLGSLRLGTFSLQTLIDNLLEGASIETGRFRVYPRSSDLASITQEAAHLMQPLLDKYGQSLTLSLPDNLPPVQADPRRTSQVLVNLLSNAIKWGPPGAEIVLAVAPLEHELQVTIADQGPGIPPEHQPVLFRRFVHVDSGSGRAEYGAGLGLSVVKAIVEAQGGRVGVTDRPGGGAVFWFTLPVASGLIEASS